jgi:hypothetical protein
MAVTPTEEGTQALASAANEAPSSDSSGNADADESYVVNGSMSGGLGAAADEQARRDRMMGMMGGRGGVGGPGGAGMMGGGIGDMAAMSAATSADPLGMNGFGAAGVLNGFGDGLGGAPGIGGGGPGGGGPGGGGGRGGGGGG